MPWGSPLGVVPPRLIVLAKIIQTGSRVTLYYTLSLADGTIVDSTPPGEPASFTLGNGELIEFLEQRLLSLAVGDQRHFAIAAVESYMPKDPETVQTLARSDFPAEMTLEPGQLFGFKTPDDREIPGRILSVSPTEVSVDFSHPLMGRDLVFDVEIVAIE